MISFQLGSGHKYKKNLNIDLKRYIFYHSHTLIRVRDRDKVNSISLYAVADLEGGVRGVRPPKIRKANVIQR